MGDGGDAKGNGENSEYSFDGTPVSAWDVLKLRPRRSWKASYWHFKM